MTSAARALLLAAAACATPTRNAPLSGSPSGQSPCDREIGQVVRERIHELGQEEAATFGTDAQVFECHDGKLASTAARRRPADSREALYGAGICLERAGQLEGAIARYDALLGSSPNGAHVEGALRRTGNLEARLQRFSRAAALLETYAARYSGENDAFDAITDAAAYRELIGQHEEAVADVRAIERNYGRRHPVPDHLRCIV